MRPIVVTSFTATSCLGPGVAAHSRALAEGLSGLAPCEFETAHVPTWVGTVVGLQECRLPAALAAYDCRNNRLAAYALEQDGMRDALERVRARYGATRIAVLLGTSTSGILSTELAYRRRDPATGALPADFHYRGTHSMFSVGSFVRELLGLEGPAAVISTACSSSAKVFAAAARMLDAGVVDAALVGGVDSLCLTTLYGFHALQLTAPGPCRPCDAERDGISIGEAAAFALLERAPASLDPQAVLLQGVGESSDAHHMSAPHPEGLGAELAMRAALRSAQAAPADVHYVNLHGTGTASNDVAEAEAVQRIFGRRVPCSSTKGATGHALGAAGALEAVVCMLAMRDALMPAGLNVRRLDPRVQIDYVRAVRRRPVERALSNSFGFGGSNCSLLFGRAG